MKQGPAQAGDPIASITARQREVLQLLAEGHPAKEIAAKLSISSRPGGCEIRVLPPRDLVISHLHTP